MYKKVEGSLHMTRNEASERYPDSYILMQMDEAYMLGMMATSFFQYKLISQFIMELLLKGLLFNVDTV